MFGEMADAALLASGNICSTRLNELGIELRHKTSTAHCLTASLPESGAFASLVIVKALASNSLYNRRLSESTAYNS